MAGGEEEMENVVSHYYSNLFNSSNPSNLNMKDVIKHMH